MAARRAAGASTPAATAAAAATARASISVTVPASRSSGPLSHGAGPASPRGPISSRWPRPSAVLTLRTPAASPGGGGLLPDGTPGGASLMLSPDTPVMPHAAAAAAAEGAAAAAGGARQRSGSAAGFLVGPGHASGAPDLPLSPPIRVPGVQRVGSMRLSTSAAAAAASPGAAAAAGAVSPAPTADHIPYRNSKLTRLLRQVRRGLIGGGQGVC